MKYYVTVTKYLSTSKLGKIVAGYVFVNYHMALINHHQLEQIPSEIEKIMNDAIIQNPRLKPLSLKISGLRETHSGFQTKSQAEVQIALSGGISAFENKDAFRLTASPVTLDISDQEGGDK